MTELFQRDRPVSRRPRRAGIVGTRTMTSNQTRLRLIASVGIALALGGSGRMALAQSAPPAMAGPGDPASMEALWSARLAAVEKHIDSLIQTLPTLPSELERLFGVFIRSLG